MRLSPYGVRIVGLVSAVSAAAAVGMWFAVGWWAILCMGPAFFTAYFFRDPDRQCPAGEGGVLAPADGKVLTVREGEMPIVGGSATVIDIFLSIFDVHINRSPVAGRVLETKYVAGKFLNALRKEAGEVNENNVILMEKEDGTRLAVKQISGVIARRIVCGVKAGDEVEAGERVGMIRFGSRTQLFIAGERRFEAAVKAGEHVKAGETVLGYLR